MKVHVAIIVAVVAIFVAFVASAGFETYLAHSERMAKIDCRRILQQ